MADEKTTGAEQVDEQPVPPETTVETTVAEALAQKQNVGSIVDNTITQQSNNSAPAEPTGGTMVAAPNLLVPSRSEDTAVLTPLQQRIAAGELILLENKEHADQVTEGVVIVYVGQDSGMTIGRDGVLQRFAPYVVGDDLPVELAQRLVANRTCALKGSDLDPYAIQPA